MNDTFDAIDDPIDFPRLQAIGLTPALAQAVLARLAAVPEVGHGRVQAMRVTEVQREHVQVHDGRHEHRAHVLAALRRQLQDDGTALAVGDWVLAAPELMGACCVVARVPPLTQIARRGADDGLRQVIASNVDTALLVMGLDHDHNLRRLERYLMLARMAQVAPVVVLTKADVGRDVEAREAQVRAALRPGEDVVAVDARAPGAATALSAWLQPGRTLVLLGSSGAGKSTLTNTLTGRATQLTGAVREDDSRGRHTTTARSLHRTPQGACIIDTPGLRTLRLDGDAQALHDAYDDLGPLAMQCRFRDCRHQDEPGCAVRAAWPAERLRHYHKLLREARRDDLTWLERRAQVQQWKQRGMSARAQMRQKGR